MTSAIVLDSEADAQRRRIKENISLSKVDYDILENGNRKYKDIDLLALPMLKILKLQVRAFFLKSKINI